MRRLLGAMVLALSAPASAEVVSVGAAGFAVRSVTAIAASPDVVWAALVKPGRWWDPTHSYSGDAMNMTLDPVAGGCFCERMPATNGMVAHGHVVHVLPGQLLRFTGALGPLQSEGVAATMSWELKPVGRGTEITQTYVVGGYIQAGAKAMAAPVDQVLAQQLERLKAFLEKSE